MLFICRRRRSGDGSAIATLGIVAVLDVPFALGLLLQEVRSRAFRAGPRNGAIVQREIALRVARTGEEDPPARTALDELPLFAVRARHAGRLRRRTFAATDLANGLAVRIAGAGEERTVAPGLEHHLFAAVLARRLRLGGDVGFQQPRILRVLAIGITGAGIELAETRALELHRFAAFVAD